MAVEITDANYEQHANSGKLVVLDFWAPWCGPCRAIAPAIEELANEYAGKAVIGKLNVDDNPETSEKFGIRNIPTILFVKNGTVVDKQVGAVPKSVLASKIESLI
ncbi:MAG: thioredoxin [Prevotellaceae bacterium]|jgi:thioredoxin 1|nr:thioredoxin [Prevotellaceae bacterium]